MSCIDHRLYTRVPARREVKNTPPICGVNTCVSANCGRPAMLWRILGGLYTLIPTHYMKIKFLTAALLGAFCCIHTSAQDIAVKTNLLYDATLTINVGAEMQVAPKWSVDLSGNYNPWTLSGGKKWKHWMIQPEARYWFCQPLGGHFVGLHLLGGEYNIGHLGHGFKFLNNDAHALSDHRYQGWFCRRRHSLRLLLAARKTLEPRSRNRHRMGLHPLRHLRVQGMWPQGPCQQGPQLRRPD